MTTINTIEDLFKLLDENPQWTEALRARLLTRELVQWPETLSHPTDDADANEQSHESGGAHGTP